MDLVSWKTVLKTLNFKLLLQACPFSLQFSSQVGLPHLNSLVTKNFPRGQKNDQIFKLFFTDSAHPDWDTGDWHIDGGALFIYSEVLGSPNCC